MRSVKEAEPEDLEKKGGTEANEERREESRNVVCKPGSLGR